MGSFICPNCGVSAYSWETPNCGYCGYTRPTSNQVKELRSQGYSNIEIIKKFTLYTAVEVTKLKKICSDKIADIKDEDTIWTTYKLAFPTTNEETLPEECTLQQEKRECGKRSGRKRKIHIKICPICGKELSRYQRYCSAKCKRKREDKDGLISVIRDDFIDLKAIKPDEAQLIADEMEIIEGKEFREMALDGLAPFRNPKIKERKKEINYEKK